MAVEPPEAEFLRRFGHDPVVKAEAPGRVNLIGEHTDYNGGFVLPTPIPQVTRVWLSPREGRAVRATSLSLDGGVDGFELEREVPGRGWLDYVQGVTTILRRTGHVIGGFDVLVDSEVPVGSGLSSSAALEVALLRALRQAFHLALDDITLALLGQRVETEFVGANVGVMDPMACSVGRPGSALFLDTESLAWRLVPLPAEAEFVVVNSGISHQHAGGDYNTRRKECEAACGLLGIERLRQSDRRDLERIARLPPPLDRRARHVVTENERVLAALNAIEAGDLVRLGSLFSQSHASQRDDYEVSIPEIDVLVALAESHPATLGARLTGGGFGGSIVALVRRGSAAAVARDVVARFSTQVGAAARVLVPASI